MLSTFEMTDIDCPVTLSRMIVAVHPVLFWRKRKKKRKKKENKNKKKQETKLRKNKKQEKRQGYSPRRAEKLNFLTSEMLRNRNEIEAQKNHILSPRQKEKIIIEKREKKKEKKTKKKNTFVFLFFIFFFCFFSFFALLFFFFGLSPPFLVGPSC